MNSKTDITITNSEESLPSSSTTTHPSSSQRSKTRRCVCFWILGILVLVIIIIFVALYFVARAWSTTYVTEVPPLTITSSNEINNIGKVIIVGAGAAGMSAAYTLEYLGIDYTILEANSDVGGRVKEIPAGSFVDVPLDVGAEWIHTDPQILQDLLLFPEQDAASEVETITYQPQTISIVTGNGKRQERNYFRHFYKEYKFYNSTWYSYLKDYFYPYIEANVELNAQVTSVNYVDNDTVLVETQDGRSFRGTHVIVATPIKILQDNDIVFDPPLPQTKQDAVDEVYMTVGLKAMIEFDQDFYPDLQSLGGVESLLSEGTLYYDALFGKPSQHHVMGLFQVGGDSTYDRTVGRSDEEILVDIMNELDDLFDGQASEHYIQSRIQNWSAEPYIRGAYSYNYNYDRDLILEAVEQKIYFCGEHVAPSDSQSTVHGAAISGRIAAQQLVLDAMSPN